jgi:hypothetical protein
MFREKLSQVPPAPKDYNITSPLPKISPYVEFYIINLLEVEGTGVSPSEHPPTWPQFYACLVFCLLSFPESPITLN